MEDPQADPTVLWSGAVRYYGELCSRPDWKWMRPIFEIAKQLSASRFCASFTPTIVDEGLELSRSTHGTDAKPTQFLRIRIGPAGGFLLEKGRRGETQLSNLECTVEAGFPTIASILGDM